MYVYTVYVCVCMYVCMCVCIRKVCNASVYTYVCKVCVCICMCVYIYIYIYIYIYMPVYTCMYAYCVDVYVRRKCTVPNINVDTRTHKISSKAQSVLDAVLSGLRKWQPMNLSSFPGKGRSVQTWCGAHVAFCKVAFLLTGGLLTVPRLTIPQCHCNIEVVSSVRLYQCSTSKTAGRMLMLGLWRRALEPFLFWFESGRNNRHVTLVNTSVRTGLRPFEEHIPQRKKKNPKTNYGPK
jgi:hypothetical protein